MGSPVITKNLKKSLLKSLQSNDSAKYAHVVALSEYIESSVRAECIVLTGLGCLGSVALKYSGYEMGVQDEEENLMRKIVRTIVTTQFYDVDESAQYFMNRYNWALEHNRPDLIESPQTKLINSLVRDTSDPNELYQESTAKRLYSMYVRHLVKCLLTSVAEGLYAQLLDNKNVSDENSAQLMSEFEKSYNNRADGGVDVIGDFKRDNAEIFHSRESIFVDHEQDVDEDEQFVMNSEPDRDDDDTSDDMALDILYRSPLAQSSEDVSSSSSSTSISLKSSFGDSENEHTTPPPSPPPPSPPIPSLTPEPDFSSPHDHYLVSAPSLPFPSTKTTTTDYLIDRFSAPLLNPMTVVDVSPC